MRTSQRLREIIRREGRRASGTDPRMPRLYGAQITGALAEAELLALPVQTAGAGSVQEFGSFSFMFDYSAFDGADPWA